ncbi:MAG: SPFH domain-containing protein [Parabacteroides johnsonii]
MQQVLDRNTNPWGITCQTVGIKDIAIPQDLAEAMSKEAQAEREKSSRHLGNGRNGNRRKVRTSQ